MKITFKIAKAELSTLFYSPIAWLLAIIFVVQCSLTFTAGLQNFVTLQDLGGMYIRNIGFMTSSIMGPPSGMFVTVIQKIYLYIPLLTMGLISREVSSGTIKLLYSSPIKISQVVFGKFLAMMGYNLLLMLIVLCFVVSASFNIQHADIGIMIAGLIGIYLLLCAYSAIGLFMSSITSYQLVAAMSTLVVFAALDFIGTVWQDIDFVRDLTYFLSIGGRTAHMVLGLISTKDVLYFLVIIYIFLGFCIIRLKSDRETKARIIIAGRYSFVFITALAIGYIFSLPALTAYLDLSAGKQMTLTENSQKIISELGDEPLEITTYVNLLDQFYWVGKPDERNNDLARWEPYLRFKPAIKLNYVYYYDTPLANKYFMLSPEGRDIEKTAKKYAKSHKADFSMFKTPAEISKIVDLKPELNRYVMQLKYKGKTTFLRVYDDVNPFPSETEVDAALKRLLIKKLPKIGFLSGEFERSKNKLGDREYGSLTSLITFRNSLVNQGFDVADISLKTGNIPDDITALVVADPKSNFTPGVLTKLKQYIDQGGNMLIAGEPGKQSVINPLLSTLGVQMMDGILVQSGKEDPADMIKPELTPNIAAISKRLEDRRKDSLGKVSMPGAAGLMYNSNGMFKIKPLLLTDPAINWSKKGKLVLDSADVVFSPADGDTKAAVPTAIALTRQINSKQQRIIVTGDADFLGNREVTRSGRLANFQFSIDLFGWFTNGQFPVDTSRPRSEDRKLNVTDSSLIMIKIFFTGILPALIAIFGGIFLIRRKRK